MCGGALAIRATVDHRPDLSLVLLGTVNGIAVIWWLGLVSPLSVGDGSSGVFGFGSDFRPIGTVALATLMPVIGAVAWRFRRSIEKPSRLLPAYFVISALFLTLSWLLASGATMVMVWLTEPWPLTLLQGPDTGRARAIFHRQFNVEPPASVSDLYARIEGYPDATVSIAF